MTDIADLTRRVEELESRVQISDLISTYAIACDERDVPRLGDLFTTDARFDSPSGLMVADGRAAIVEMFVAILKARGPGYHWTHDHFIRFDRGSPDAASGLVLSHAETTPNGTVSLAAMRYDDEYRREAGVWRFAKRSIHFLYYVPASEFSNSLNESKRLVAGDRRLAADFPETLSAWQAFEREFG